MAREQHTNGPAAGGGRRAIAQDLVARVNENPPLRRELLKVPTLASYRTFLTLKDLKGTIEYNGS